MQTVESKLAARLARLEAERDILHLLHAVCTAVDGEVAAAWLDCFTQDGAFSWAPIEGAAVGLDLNGRAELGDWFTKHRTINPVGSQMHLLLHPVIVVEGDHARATTSYLTVRRTADGLQLASAGRYMDQVRRESDGPWRVSEHRAIGAMSG